MVISRIAFEGALKNYDRQNRIAIAEKKLGGAGRIASADRVSLSPVAQKISMVNELAAKRLEKRFPEATPEELGTLIKEENTRLLFLHKPDIESLMSPEEFARKLSEEHKDTSA